MEEKSFKDFIAFKIMVTPLIIQVIFWLGIAGVFAAGVFNMTRGGVGVLMGIVVWIFGALYVRVLCELMIIFFRIYETLKDIRNNTPTGLQKAWQSSPQTGGSTDTGTESQCAQKYCPKCGELLSHGLKFCNHCGSPLE